MSIVSDGELIEMCEDVNYGEGSEFKPMIKPFYPHTVSVNDEGQKIISYGLASYGYDVRLKDGLKIFTNVGTTEIDPKNLDQRCLTELKANEDGYILIPANSHALGVTVESFSIPDDITPMVLTKSTYARSGLVVVTTTAQAGWKGELVIELSNATPLPIRVYPNEGIAQLVFFRGEIPCVENYYQRGGKYQNQSGITLPKV